MPASPAPSPRPASRVDESAYDRRRLRQWLAGDARADGVSRRRLLTLLAATAAATALPAPRPAHAADTPIVKPLPPEWFIQRGTNAETRWEALRGTGHHTPNELFFVRNHTATPVLDAADWRLRLWGDGLRGKPAEGRPVEFGYDDLRALPAVTRTAFVECAGNGRSHYTTQQQEAVSGTSWTLGAVGVARWRGVRLADVLRKAGLSPYAVDLQPRGLDAEYVSAARASAGCAGRCRWPRRWTTSCSRTR
jgi:DMSO/TMAO reductase YedYZ molybdopterin-dependent catalytic subunit